MKPREIETQLKNFQKGFPPIVLKEAATTKQGIHKLSPKATEELAARFEEYAQNHQESSSYQHLAQPQECLNTCWNSEQNIEELTKTSFC